MGKQPTQLFRSLQHVIEAVYALHSNVPEIGFQSYDKFTALLREQKVYREEYFCTLLDVMAFEFREIKKSLGDTPFVSSTSPSSMEGNYHRIRLRSAMSYIHGTLSGHTEMATAYMLELGGIVEDRRVYNTSHALAVLDEFNNRSHDKLSKI